MLYSRKYVICKICFIVYRILYVYIVGADLAGLVRSASSFLTQRYFDSLPSPPGKEGSEQGQEGEGMYICCIV